MTSQKPWRQWWIRQFKYDPCAEPLQVSQWKLVESEHYEVIHVIEAKPALERIRQLEEEIEKLKAEREDFAKLYRDETGNLIDFISNLRSKLAEVNK